MKTGLNRTLIPEILEKADDCEGRLSELLIDSATDESKTNYLIKPTYQQNSYEIVYLSRTRKGTMRSKMLTKRTKYKKIKMGSKVMGRNAGKVEANPEFPGKTASLAEWKRVEDVDDLGQGDNRLQGNSKGTDLSAVPPIVLAGLNSASYKAEKSNRTLTGPKLEMEILSQYGDSTLKDLKSSRMNHGKGSVVGQLIPVEYSRLTVSDTVMMGKPAGEYFEMMEFRNSVRGRPIALENKDTIGCYLEEIMKDTIMKQKAYGTLASSEMHTERVDQLVSLPWRAVLLRQFQERMGMASEVHALIATPFVRTEVKLRLTWFLAGLTGEEYDSEE